MHFSDIAISFIAVLIWGNFKERSYQENSSQCLLIIIRRILKDLSQEVSISETVEV